MLCCETLIRARTSALAAEIETASRQATAQKTLRIRTSPSPARIEAGKMRARKCSSLRWLSAFHSPESRVRMRRHAATRFHLHRASRLAAGARAAARAAETRRAAASRLARGAHERTGERAGKGSVRRKEAARFDARALDRFLRAWLSRRRRCAPNQRPDLAGDAALAQPKLGPPGADRLFRAIFQE